jgi:F0F1-type ATP synthase assembly protein I
MTNSDDRHQTYQGLGNGFSRAFELGLTPAIFGLLGFGLDRLLGTTPWFTILMAVLGLVGVFLRMWYGYDAEMRAHEEQMLASITGTKLSRSKKQTAA